jgi:hypothetical protein
LRQRAFTDQQRRGLRQTFGLAVARALAELVRGGTVEVDEALAMAVDKAELARRLGRTAG